MIEQLRTLDDPRVEVYRNLRRSQRSVRRGEFVVEGENVVRRLLRSDFPVVSVLASDRRLESLASDLPENVPVLVAGHEAVSELVGYKFHSGVLACGVAKPNPSLEILDACFASAEDRGVVVICVHIDNPDNLGTILRTCSGFGVKLVIAAQGCADPFSRRVLRVAMGEAFRIPIRVTEDLDSDLTQLHERWQFTRIATVLEPDAAPLAQVPPPPRSALLLGNEAHGLDHRWIQASDLRVRIPMANEVDSLNVAVACGICVHHFTD